MQFDTPPPAKGRPLTLQERQRLQNSPHPFHPLAWARTRPDGRIVLMYPGRRRFILRDIT